MTMKIGLLSTGIIIGIALSALFGQMDCPDCQPIADQCLQCQRNLADCHTVLKNTLGQKRLDSRDSIDYLTAMEPYKYTKTYRFGDDYQVKIAVPVRVLRDIWQLKPGTDAVMIEMTENDAMTIRPIRSEQ